jgi:hypothetical protein
MGDGGASVNGRWWCRCNWEMVVGGVADGRLRQQRCGDGDAIWLIIHHLPRNQSLTSSFVVVQCCLRRRRRWWWCLCSPHSHPCLPHCSLFIAHHLFVRAHLVVLVCTRPCLHSFICACGCTCSCVCVFTRVTLISLLVA